MEKSLVAKIFLICIVITFFGCHSEEPEPLGKYMQPYCQATKQIAKSYKNCQCNVTFRNYSYLNTFTGISSTYNQIGPPCNQNLFTIKYISMYHDHNEADFEFGFYLPKIENNQFFRPDTFQIDTIYIGEWSLSGGHGGPKPGVDVTFIWESISVNENIYSGKGKFIINKPIPTSFPGYYWPVQEIPFEFCESRRDQLANKNNK